MIQNVNWMAWRGVGRYVKNATLSASEGVDGEPPGIACTLRLRSTTRWGGVWPPGAASAPPPQVAEPRAKTTLFARGALGRAGARIQRIVQVKLKELPDRDRQQREAPGPQGPGDRR